MNKPQLYYQCIDGIPFDNFCSDAAIGANNSGIVVIPFEDVSEIPYNPYNIVVTSVEDTQKYLGKTIPVISHSWAIRQGYLKRTFELFSNIAEIDFYPCFIKPAEEIKAFTGFVAEDKDSAKQLSYNFEGPVIVQEVIEIESEYRVYMCNSRGVLGVHHYLGNPFLTLNKEFVEKVCRESQINLLENSYTLDFGINNKGETFLIEVNDGWAIGNYGMSPNKYYHFVKNRFLQLTGVLKYEKSISDNSR